MKKEVISMKIKVNFAYLKTIINLLKKLHDSSNKKMNQREVSPIEILIFLMVTYMFNLKNMLLITI